MVNTSITMTSVTRHRSSNQVSKESRVTGMIANNQITLYQQASNRILF